MPLDDFLSLNAHGDSLLVVNDPHPTVGSHAAPQLEPYVHDNLANHIEHMDFDADN